MTPTHEDHSTTAQTANFDEIEMPLWDYADLKIPNSGKWHDEGVNCLATLRLAGHTLTKSKPELLHTVKTILRADEDGDLFVSLVEDMEILKHRLAEWSSAVTAAQARLVCAFNKIETDHEYGGTNSVPEAQH